MIVLHDPATLLHETVELLGAKVIPALESPARIKAIVSVLAQSTHSLEYLDFQKGDGSKEKSLIDLAAQTHRPDYLQHIKEVFDTWLQAGLIAGDGDVLPECFVFPSSAGPANDPPKDIYARAGYYAFDMSTGIMDKTYVSALASAHLAYEAVRQLREKHVKEVLALCRPPGHHCNGRRAGGYCYINNAAVAASAWRVGSPGCRVGILDIDYHHGNGTQDIFYADPDTFYTSIHGADEFPYYTGLERERGEGPAVGTNLNLPLEKASSFDQYLAKLDVALTALSAFRPELLLVSLGFDTFRLDPLGNFEIDTEDYEVLARTVRQRMPDIPAVILLEGGYAIDHLGQNLLSFMKGWEGPAR